MVTFPESFLFGCATSAHQVEGGNHNNDWWAWEQRPGKIHDGSRAGGACGWWDGRAEEDLTLAAEYGQNAHRLSVEWSRLEPERGRFDGAAFDRYAHLLAHMRRLKMSSMVTLHHFTLPRWTDENGFVDPGLAAAFGAFAGECARRLGSLVDRWVTLNEPMVLGFMGYLGRAWPPGCGSPVALARATRTMRRAHLAAFEAVHRVQAGAQVGIVLNMPGFAPARPGDPRDRAAAGLQELLFNQAFLAALGGRYDFLGLNYYGRYDVRFSLRAAGQGFGEHVQRPTVATPNNDWGQIDPAGLKQRLIALAHLGRPLYVTENGVFDNDDAIRPAFLQDHLRAVHAALAAGADVRGYFHWSLVDNFEWAEGWSTHFGLFAVDRRTQVRTPRPSARVYAEICRAARR
jgi:beta-glucosidase